MGLFKKMSDVAKDGAGLASSLSSSIASSISGIGKSVHKHKDEGKREETKETNVGQVSVETVSNEVEVIQPVVIDSLAGMETWLQGFMQYAKPSALQALQVQLQVLNFVQSPTMAGMAVDSMLACLNKSLKYAESEVEKDEIREAFTSMVQNFVFVSEARLRYAIESNKEEAAKMLSTAGDVLSRSVVGVASLAGGVKAMARVVVKNVFSSPEVQKGFLTSVISWKNNKAELKKKEKEYYDLLVNLFDLFDTYASLIGPSILVHGMLRHYIPYLMDSCKQQKFKLVKDRLAELKRDEFLELLGNTSVNVNIMDLARGNISSLASTVTNITKNMGTSKAFTKSGEGDFESISSLATAAATQIAKLQHGIEQDSAQIEALEKEVSKLSLINVLKKKELNGKIEELENEKEELARKLKKAQAWQISIQALKDEATPIQAEIEAFEVRLNQVADKYKVIV